MAQSAEGKMVHLYGIGVYISIDMNIYASHGWHRHTCQKDLYVTSVPYQLGILTQVDEVPLWIYFAMYDVT